MRSVRCAKASRGARVARQGARAAAARAVRAGGASAQGHRHLPRPRATASARCATCACARRCSSRCGTTTPSSSATAASGSSTTCLPRRRLNTPSSGRSRLVMPAVALRSRSRRLRHREHRRRLARQSRARRLRRPHRAGRRHRRRAEGVARHRHEQRRRVQRPARGAALGRGARHEDAAHPLDSELLVKQMKGVYRVKNPGLQPLYEEARGAGAADRPRDLRARAAGVQQGRRPARQRGDGRSCRRAGVNAGPRISQPPGTSSLGRSEPRRDAYRRGICFSSDGMAERNPPSWDEIRGLIERVDEVCKESEKVRDRADHSMRQRPIWPDRRRAGRSLDPPSPPDDGKKPT